MICVTQSPFMSQFNFNPSTLPYRFVFPKPPLLTLDGSLESLRFSFLAPTFLHMDATQERGLLAHPL